MKRINILLIISLIFALNINASEKKGGLFVGYESSSGGGTRTTKYSQARSNGYYVYTYKDEYEIDISQSLGLIKIGYISDTSKQNFFSVALKTGSAETELTYSNGNSFTMEDIKVSNIEYIGYYKKGSDNSGLGLKVEIDSYSYKFIPSDEAYYGQSEWTGASFVWGANYFYQYESLLATIGIDYRSTLWDVIGGENDYTTYLKKDSGILGVFSISYIF